MKKLFLFLIITLLSPVIFYGQSNNTMEKNTMAVNQFFNRLQNGEDLKVIALGGSITTGFASNPIKTNSWAALTGKYLIETSKQYGGKLTFMNQGVSGTDSAFAIARLEDHIISQKPDLLLLEFAMNDQWLDSKVRQRTYETIIRKVLSSNNTAVIALFVNERAAPYSSNQKEQQKICEYYGVPYVSWKDCMEKDGLLADFEKCFDGTEGVHPNNYGHKKISEYMITKIDELINGCNKSDAINKSVELPAAMFANGFENAVYYHMDNITPADNTGWRTGTPVHPEWVEHGKAHKGWECNVPGAEITFELSGKSVGVTYCESDQFRDAIAWITKEDGTNTQKIPLQNFVSYRNGYYGWAYKELVSLDKEENFVLHIQCNKRASKNAEGRFCNITGILVAK